MPVAVDHKGKLTITTDPATRGLQGRTFRRRKPLGDGADVIVVNGAIDVGNADVGSVAELVVSSANFGELVDGEDAVTTIGLDEFADIYVELATAEVASIRADQAIASAEDTKKAVADAKADRIPTWRRYR